MQAFHNQQSIKDFYLARLQAHYAADEIIQGTYWSHGKGCAVGCTIHGDEHARYEAALGIPQAIARVQDQIFEGLPNADAKEFPLTFLRSIRVGADLSGILPRFFVWLLIDQRHGVIRFASTDGKEAIRHVADIYRRQIDGETILKSEWITAAYAAAAASAAAHSYARAAEVAAAAAEAAADEAAYAADEAAYAADAAADVCGYAAAAEAAAAYAAAYAARREHYKLMASQLIALLEQA